MTSAYISIFSISKYLFLAICSCWLIIYLCEEFTIVTHTRSYSIGLGHYVFVAILILIFYCDTDLFSNMVTPSVYAVHIQRSGHYIHSDLLLRHRFDFKSGYSQCLRGTHLAIGSHAFKRRFKVDMTCFVLKYTYIYFTTLFYIIVTGF